ncbi:uncharacterized protein LOC128554771, partial [Mercenaria mercenaria]|uniref:uncharacterized protein LOC128554771 n=1 Tax=Mercenaria mercenaria TaxID=6596 RepID=UPI00234F567C
SSNAIRRHCCDLDFSTECRERLTKYDDNFCKTVLNRSFQKLSHELDPYSLLGWCCIKGYLTYQQEHDIQEQTNSNKTRELLKAVSSRGAIGYKEMKRWLFTHHVYLFQYLGKQEAELEKMIMAVKELEERNRQARSQKSVTPLQTGNMFKGWSPQTIERYFKAISIITEDECSVLQKCHKQTLKASGQLIDFYSPCHEIQEMVIYNTKMTVIERRTISTGWKDPYRDLYRTSAYLLILFGSTAFEEKQELVQDIESIWKHIFWNEFLSTYSLSVLQKDKYEKETKDAKETITAEFLKFKYEAPVEVSVHIDNVSMEEQPTAGSYDKQAAEEFRALEQMLMCKVCLDADLCIVFFPCGHIATCESCASAMQICPVCRSVIQESVKLNYE